MHYGLAIFPTEYSISPTALATAAEERGFESLWVAEHSHIPASRKTPWPGGADLPQIYYDVELRSGHRQPEAGAEAAPAHSRRRRDALRPAPRGAVR
jgi:alkanesulfonate monooxygenase SsuD/methylene tetrahydromethanopterin reductase-like flavin-dependent oxidoreductase (luciferase family)